jgi:hypothetical protein
MQVTAAGKKRRIDNPRIEVVKAKELPPLEKIKRLAEICATDIPPNSVFRGEAKLKKFKDCLAPAIERLYPYIDEPDLRGVIDRILKVCYHGELPPERTERFCNELAYQLDMYCKNAGGNTANRFRKGHLEQDIARVKPCLDYWNSFKAVSNC